MAGDGVWAVLEAGEGRIVQPRVLHELELAADVRVQAEEVQPALVVGMFRVPGRGAVLPPAADEPVPVVHPDSGVGAGTGVQRVTRIGAADVRGDGAPEAEVVPVAVVPEVVVDRLGIVVVVGAHR
jgi:hypothetical protein